MEGKESIPGLTLKDTALLLAGEYDRFKRFIDCRWTKGSNQWKQNGSSCSYEFIDRTVAQDVERRLITLDCRPQSLSVFGLKPFQRIQTPTRGKATVMGVAIDDEGCENVWILIDGDDGVSYYSPCDVKHYKTVNDNKFPVAVANKLCRFEDISKHIFFALRDVVVEEKHKVNYDLRDRWVIENMICKLCYHPKHGGNGCCLQPKSNSRLGIKAQNFWAYHHPLKGIINYSFYIVCETCYATIDENKTLSHKQECFPQSETLDILSSLTREEEVDDDGSSIGKDNEKQPQLPKEDENEYLRTDSLRDLCCKVLCSGIKNSDYEEQSIAYIINVISGIETDSKEAWIKRTKKTAVDNILIKCSNPQEVYYKVQKFSLPMEDIFIEYCENLRKAVPKWSQHHIPELTSMLEMSLSNSFASLTESLGRIVSDGGLDHCLIPMWVRTLSDIRDEYKLTHAYCVKKINGQNLFNLSNSQAFLNLNDNLRTILNVECAEQLETDSKEKRIKNETAYSHLDLYELEDEDPGSDVDMEEEENEEDNQDPDLCMD